MSSKYSYQEIKALSDRELIAAYIMAERDAPKFRPDAKLSFMAQKNAHHQIPAVQTLWALSSEMTYRFEDCDAEARRNERNFGC